MMKLKIGVRFVQTKGNNRSLSEKQYFYLIDHNLVLRNKKHYCRYSFYIANEKGFDYHGNQVVVTTIPIKASFEEIISGDFREIKTMYIGEEIYFDPIMDKVKQEMASSPLKEIFYISNENENAFDSIYFHKEVLNTNNFFNSKTKKILYCRTMDDNIVKLSQKDIIKDYFEEIPVKNQQVPIDKVVIDCFLVDAENSEVDDKKEKETAKGEKNMFDKMMKNFEFGVATDVMMSMYGPAFATKDGTYIAFDSGKKEYVDVCDFVFDMDNMPMAYKMPVATKDVKVNDYIRHKDSWVRVVEKKAKGQLVVEKIAEKEIVTIIPTKNMFGFDFYTKLICFGETMFKGSANENMPFGNILPFMMLSQSDFDGDMTPMMMMMAMGNGSFDFSKPEGMMMMMAMMGGEKSNMMMPMMMMNMMNNSACVEERDKVLTNDDSWEYADTCENE